MADVSTDVASSRAKVAELPYLIRLLDDESESVRAAVGGKLFAYRDCLDEELAAQGLRLSEQHERTISEILRERGRDWLRENWMSWREEPVEQARLASGLESISEFLNDFRRGSGTVAEALDALAEQCRLHGADRDVISLKDYLFGSGRFRGNRGEYYGPQNSDLVWVMKSGRGNPISLSCVYILVGWRCGLQVDGCNYPGHFLARLPGVAENLLVDCFNRGKIIGGEDLIEHQPFASREVRDAVECGASAEAVLTRVLRNLETAFTRLGNRADQRVVRKLLQQIAP